MKKDYKKLYVFFDIKKQYEMNECVALGRCILLHKIVELHEFHLTVTVDPCKSAVTTPFYDIPTFTEKRSVTNFYVTFTRSRLRYCNVNSKSDIDSLCSTVKG